MPHPLWTLRPSALLILAVVLIAFGPAPASAVECGDVITEDTVLDRDLVDCPGDGLVIGGDHLSLDLAGHSILNRLEAPQGCCVGVRLENRHGVTIENGRIIGFDTAVSLEDANDNEISRLLAPVEPEGTTFSLRRSHRNRLIENESRGELGSGIVLEASRKNKILRNVVIAEPAIMLLQSHGNTIQGNHTDGIFDDGIVLDSSHRNRITDNRTAADGAALALFDSDHNWIFRNSIHTFVHTSLVLVGSAHNRVEQNDVQGVDWARSIDVSASSGVVLRRNRVSGGEDGILVDGSSRFVLILENQVFENADDGIDVETASAFLRGNIAFDNGDYGIEALPGVKDLGRNSAEGNGNPDQCLNVECESP